MLCYQLDINMTPVPCTRIIFKPNEPLKTFISTTFIGLAGARFETDRSYILNY